MKRMEDTMPLERIESSPSKGPRLEDIPAKIQRPDPLRRFTPTPYVAALPVMGRTLQLETNDLRILERAAEVFAPYPGSPDGQPDFLWRIVIQSHPQMNPPWPKRSAFSDDSLRFAEFGQKNFLAVDLEACEGIGFLAEGLADDELGLTWPFIDTIFYLTAGSLGLVSLTATCVASGEKGLLVMGPPDSGKTSASYLAAKDGLSFHSDQAVFLETKNHGLCAWGDFFPAVFRPQALQFFPELQASARPLSYCDLTFYYLSKRKFQSPRAHPVVPVCCVFLERNSTPEPRLTSVSRADLLRRLFESLPFKDDNKFDAQRASILGSLVELPAYHLAYGSDPGVAALFLGDLLAKHGMP
jgi:hypothetical protein